jgi:hypothetical protein
MDDHSGLDGSLLLRWARFSARWEDPDDHDRERDWVRTHYPALDPDGRTAL